ncbi:ATP-binding protein [Palleniella muris]|uniref:ATP-binding protein n=1 Tax=Palleniella muris TaxID=3038145 RepID=A0AC61QM78_9BACT|nr:ATP-binding protein [Palleniella muris]TGX80162.1 ATP-binding protein [Palleniella muris]
MQVIERPYYSTLIKPFIGKNIIKVLTGQRRVGKSCILRQLQQFVASVNPATNIIYINKELEEFATIRNHNDFTAYVSLQLKTGVPNSLFVDEIQDIEGFEKTLRSLQAQGECDIFITGSNATMLSGELATCLSGRYVEFHIHSLNYSEFLQFHGLQASNSSLRQYLTFGGLPFLKNLELEEYQAFEYLRNVYSTIVLKDVVKRENIRNISFMETLALYMSDNIGQLFSANNISKYLKSQHVNISTLQVVNYLRTLCNAYLINKVGRMDIAGLRKFEIGDKYFFEDIGLRNCNIGFSFQRDIHKLIENAVFLHLHSIPGVCIHTGQIGKQEIDFVAVKGDKRIYTQATYLLSSEQTVNREFGNLRSVPDNYPKYVVSLDEWTSSSNIDGINHLHLGEFLQLTDLLS